MYTHSHIRTHTHTHVHIHVHALMHTHTYTHAHTRTHTGTWRGWSSRWYRQGAKAGRWLTGLALLPVFVCGVHAVQADDYEGEVLAYTGMWVGLARIIYIRCIYTVIMAGNSPNIHSYTVCIYGSGQLYM
jgi:hypothetical protein